MRIHLIEYILCGYILSITSYADTTYTDTTYESTSYTDTSYRVHIIGYIIYRYITRGYNLSITTHADATYADTSYRIHHHMRIYLVEYILSDTSLSITYHYRNRSESLMNHIIG